MYGAQVETDWQEGSSITWKGEYEGKPYEDKGQILEVMPGQRLGVTHYSPLSGQDDVPESYRTVSCMIGAGDGRAHLVVSRDGSGSEDEAQRSREMWQEMLDGLKRVAEGSAG